MSSHAEFHPLAALTPDGRRLFLTRIARLFAYGFLSVVLVLYLRAVGLDDYRVGLLLTLTLVGDLGISLWITTSADRLGRRRMLILGAMLMAFAGVLFAITGEFVWLLIAATIGVISPSGNEVGPFLSIEQAALTETLPESQRTAVFAWYNLVGSFATALGSLAGGLVCQWTERAGYQGAAIYRPVLYGYAFAGLALAFIFWGLSAKTEATPKELREGPTSLGQRFGLHRSLGTVMRLSGLFALDAFAGGLIVQSVLAYWFTIRFGIEPAALGGIFFGTNLLGGFSALAAARMAKRFGLINTMVFTHLPSNILLMLVPLAPNLPLAIGLLMLRSSISQMDVPTRQSYTMAVVLPEERSAASGVTAVARSLGAAISPVLVTSMVGDPQWSSVPFYLAGGLKIVYDLLLYRSFVSLKPPEEVKP